MIILASKSPRRYELMKKYITNSFLVVPSTNEEIINKNIPIEEAIKEVAYKKGKSIKELYPQDIVISADTVVILDGEILGKPIDKIDAYNMLKKMSNKTHLVLTSYSILYEDKVISRNVFSKVTFNKLEDSLINEYIETLSPLDKAGSYGIQDELGNKLVKKYEGSLNNIIGFPVEDIKKDLKDLNLI